MTDPDKDRYITLIQRGMAAMLEARGYAPPTVAALLDLDATQFQFQQSMAKGEFLQLLIARRQVPLELAQMRGLYAVARISHGIHRPAPMPATIGLVSEELGLDPSRASRIVADLVAGGYVARLADQSDGRVSVITLTDKGHALVVELRQDRWEMFLAVFDGWSEADIIAFSTLYARYGQGMARVMAAPNAPDSV
jgi:DNA-binding MarR family transcriptional regulator